MREPVIADADVVVDVLLGLMTTEEKVALLGGLNMWETVAIPRLGIKSLKTTDGPAGAKVLYGREVQHLLSFRAAFPWVLHLILLSSIMWAGS